MPKPDEYSTRERVQPFSFGELRKIIRFWNGGRSRVRLDDSPITQEVEVSRREGIGVGEELNACAKLVEDLLVMEKTLERDTTIDGLAAREQLVQKLKALPPTIQPVVEMSVDRLLTIWEAVEKIVMNDEQAYIGAMISQVLQVDSIYYSVHTYYISVYLDEKNMSHAYQEMLRSYGQEIDNDARVPFGFQSPSLYIEYNRVRIPLIVQLQADRDEILGRVKIHERTHLQRRLFFDRPSRPRDETNVKSNQSPKHAKQSFSDGLDQIEMQTAEQREQFVRRTVRRHLESQLSLYWEELRGAIAECSWGSDATRNTQRVTKQVQTISQHFIIDANGNGAYATFLLSDLYAMIAIIRTKIHDRNEAAKLFLQIQNEIESYKLRLQLRRQWVEQLAEKQEYDPIQIVARMLLIPDTRPWMIARFLDMDPEEFRQNYKDLTKRL